MSKKMQDQEESDERRASNDSPEECAGVLESSPTSLLRAMRGVVVGAQLAHPEVLHVEIKDACGGIWRLATQDAEWSPAAHEQLVGLSVDRAQVDAKSGGLRCDLSDGTALTVTPGSGGSSGELPVWELISPSGLSLELSTGIQWAISQAQL
jgi:hypothetical protein